MLRTSVVGALTVVSALLANSDASAQVYPVRSVRMVVPFAAGGGADILARLIGPKLSESWGQSVVIDNRPGAGGTLGSELVAKAPPDGYTLIMATVSTHAVAVSLYRKIRYDPDRDFAAVTMVADVPNYLVTHPSVPVKSVKELIALAKARPNDLVYASSGNGTSGHLSMELFKTMAKVQAIHVPFKGSAPGTAALISGEVHMQFASVLPLLPFVKAGRLRALAVSGTTRSPALPDVPTVAEFLPGYDATTWYGILAPAQTPTAVVSKIYTDTRKIVSSAEFRDHLTGQGANAVGSSPDEFSAYIRSEIQKWARVVRDSGVKVE